VVLPLVPDTNTIRRPAASRERMCGAKAKVTRPPMTAPAPRPSRRDTAAAADPPLIATRAHPPTADRPRGAALSVRSGQAMGRESRGGAATEPCVCVCVCVCAFPGPLLRHLRNPLEPFTAGSSAEGACCVQHAGSHHRFASRVARRGGVGQRTFMRAIVASLGVIP
jgi:hypothetical protein